MSEWMSYRSVPPPLPPRRPAAVVDPLEQRLKSIAGDLRVIGILFILLGLLATLASLGAMSAMRGSWTSRVLLVSSLFVLLLPGGWFTYAASLVGGARGGVVVRWSLGVAGLQAIATLATLGITLANGGGLMRGGPTAIPVLLLVFFIPAQVALLVQLVRARGLISAREARHGFATGAPLAANVPAGVDPAPIAMAQSVAPTGSVAPTAAIATAEPIATAQPIVEAAPVVAEVVEVPVAMPVAREARR